ncbi:hypothetical protein [Photobacterium sp.]|uniref:hypothetical protein n=1 Tax=Photobacterium sp. TaxID=660 RepID=UPI00299E6F6F|nr:hypothetical protein [Photobacterium sp.]MDX1300995.1 hypothetical protein [Photobacterium sp.]
MLTFTQIHNFTQQNDEPEAEQPTALSEKEVQRQALLKQAQQDGGIKVIEQ